MSFIKFESASEKERLRQELRNAREELLNKAKQNAEIRAKLETDRKLKGEDNWMLPSLSQKIEKQSEALKKAKKQKKSSKEKKHKHGKKKKKKCKEEKNHKKKSKKCERTTDTDNSSESDSSLGAECSNDEWIEKEVKVPVESVQRDSWMTGSFLLPTYSKVGATNKEKEKSLIDTYDPAKSTRELNPYWKDGGTGLPEFKKPKEDEYYSRTAHSHSRPSSGNWRKKDSSQSVQRSTISRSDRIPKEIELAKSDSSSPEHESIKNDKATKSGGISNFLTNQQMNELGAKLIKAEIIGNEELVTQLKEKLEKARIIRSQLNENNETKSMIKSLPNGESEHILLTTTDNRGMTRPLPSRSSTAFDPYSSNKKGKRRNIDTHVDGKRAKYFPDDDRYDIKQMFEREKYATASESDAQFAEIAGRQKNTKDDLEDIFADKVRKEISEQEKEENEKKRAIREHDQLTKVLDSCDRCIDSPKMEKQLLVSMGSAVYLTLPWHEGLQPGHCMIIPIQHISCSTQLDEDAWSEISDFRKALTRMFAARSQDVVFFEIARYLNKRPHMVIHCIPSKNFEMAPFYFKKAIQESEYMWSTNKQLITLKDKDVRRAIPKGLPYFWVNFGMDNGFAHVIEDQERFPANFAQEIIGGMLELDARVWRKPRKEQNSIHKVKQLADWWKPFDCTK